MFNNTSVFVKRTTHTKGYTMKTSKKSGKTVEKISGLRLSPEMDKRLNDICKATNKKKSYHLRVALDQHLNIMEAVISGELEGFLCNRFASSVLKNRQIEITNLMKAQFFKQSPAPT